MTAVNYSTAQGQGAHALKIWRDTSTSSNKFDKTDEKKTLAEISRMAF